MQMNYLRGWKNGGLVWFEEYRTSNRLGSSRPLSSPVGLDLDY